MQLSPSPIRIETAFDKLMARFIVPSISASLVMAFFLAVN